MGTIREITSNLLRELWEATGNQQRGGEREKKKEKERETRGFKRGDRRPAQVPESSTDTFHLICNPWR